MELVVQPLGRSYAVTPGSNLLETLRHHHVPVSYSCTAGRCGTCHCKVIDGKVLESGREEENTKLKKLVADLSLDKVMLQDVVRRKL